MTDKGKILLALSGGVDSTASAILLQEMGYEVIAVNYIITDNDLNFQGSSAAQDPSTISAAKDISDKLNIPLHTLDLRDVFQKNVIDKMIFEYSSGRTPNPCALCNPTIKWPYLLKTATKLGIEKIATGHYARVSVVDGKPYLAKGKDITKDQSYFMYRIDKKYLERVVFPLENMTKKDSQNLMKQKGLSPEKKHKSKDLCFLDGENLQSFFAKTIKPVPGDIFLLDENKIAGKHPDIQSLTVGQRRGLSIPWDKPLYVISRDIVNKRAIVGDREHLYFTDFYISNLFWTHEEPDPDEQYTVRIRSTHQGTICKVTIKDDLAKIVMSEPCFALTPGQSAVIYQDNRVIGGGIIGNNS